MALVLLRAIFCNSVSYFKTISFLIYRAWYRRFIALGISLFEFNMNGKELDAYVKKQVEAYRLQAKSFGLAK